MNTPIVTPGQLRNARTAYDASLIALDDAMAGFKLMQLQGTDEGRKAARRGLTDKIQNVDMAGEKLRGLYERAGITIRA